ncbi:MAG: twin-arginine translocase subunit TatC [Proteobacteria bacterium]|nr:twin-arginine translocase subunit TatC [Pseudomonadota bacterium]
MTDNMSDQDYSGVNEPDESPLIYHLGELRSRLIRSLLVIFLLFVISMAFSADLIKILKWPLKRLGENFELNFIEVTEPFLVSLRVSLLSALIIAAPFWIYQVWRFAQPGLYLKERKYFSWFLLLSLFLFWLGVLFCFFIMLPLTLEFLIHFGKDFATAQLTLKSYISFFSTLVLGFGLAFQLPLVILILTLSGLITSESLVKARKYVIIGCFVFSALLTPPDWVSQVGLAVPLYLLYELGLFVVKFIEKKEDKAPMEV